MDNYNLQLTHELKFEAVSTLTNVFFDDNNQQIFAIRSATNVIVKTANSLHTLSFLLENRGSTAITAIKFNSDNSLLALQRSESSIEIYLFQRNNIVPNSLIIFEVKKTIIFGFVWLASTEIALITEAGVEIYQVFPAKKTLKSIKSTQISSSWFIWCHQGQFALVSSNSGTTLTPILLKPGTLNKLKKLEIDDEEKFQERDVTLGTLYDIPAILLLKQASNRTLEILIFLLDGPGFAPRKAHILRLGYSGRVALNIIDNIVLVHHQTTKTSMLFDIALNGEVNHQDKSVRVHSALAPGKSIKPCSMKIPSLNDSEAYFCDLYSPNWVLFQPNIVIDAKLGYLWHLELILESISSVINDRVILVEVLLMRANGKRPLLAVLKEMLSDEFSELHLPVLEVIFNKLNKLYKTRLDFELQGQMALPPSLSFQKNVPKVMPAQSGVIVDQHDMNMQIFTNISDKTSLGKVLLLYIYSLLQNAITCDYDLSKTLILNLTQKNKLETLQQILSYSIMHESKPLACFLLSLSAVSPIISQIALDMLKRLNANEIIIEILLEQGRVIDAIKLSKQTSDPINIVPRKFLDAALRTKNLRIFFSVYTYFIHKNMRLRSSEDFLKSEFCDEFVNYYNQNF